MFNFDELFEFHHEFISLLRWKLEREEYEATFGNVSLRLEKFHSQYLNCSELTCEQVYDALLGDILKKDPHFILRQMRVQGNKELLGRKQSISTNSIITAVYPKLISKLVESWFNPIMDDKSSFIDTAILSFLPDNENLLENGRGKRR